jgi:hypothetical protein
MRPNLLERSFFRLLNIASVYFSLLLDNGYASDRYIGSAVPERGCIKGSSAV